MKKMSVRVSSPRLADHGHPSSSFFVFIVYLLLGTTDIKKKNKKKLNPAAKNPEISKLLTFKLEWARV